MFLNELDCNKNGEILSKDIIQFINTIQIHICEPNIKYANLHHRIHNFVIQNKLSLSDIMKSNGFQKDLTFEDFLTLIKVSKLPINMQEAKEVFKANTDKDYLNINNFIENLNISYNDNKERSTLLNLHTENEIKLHSKTPKCNINNRYSRNNKENVTSQEVVSIKKHKRENIMARLLNRTKI